MLAKIELAMQDKDARAVLEMISKFSGLPPNMPQKIFVFDMNINGNWFLVCFLAIKEK